MAAPRRKKPVNADFVNKAPTETHEAFAAYVTETTGRETGADTVALVQRLYPLYLKSPAVVKARDAAAAQREKEAAAAAAAKRAKAQARLDKIEAQRARLLKELGLDGDTVIDASNRFTDGGGITFEKADDDEEFDADEGQEDHNGHRPVSVEDDEPEEVAVTVEDDDEDWDDDDDDEDEEDF